MAGIAAWKQSSTLSSIVCEQTILPFLANNLNPPMIPVTSLSSLSSRNFPSMIMLHGISEGLLPSNILTCDTI